ncbi:hypothetical protein SYNPS1DRAFT_20719 [Syncephalis pseudoplumigaleata]|uniref:P-loop containing nucleoside triphosphate hydrolase protein n=1 Tax=Syncephalis pseudoplumigaleata TaxID=1712513 RepID=A0A4P9Z819_9FUNG|nr:hypothetical protein SYNPS1DRAFT_20719 [Syncephalis pseudoplumigaleata]|eukprot:RKP27880.1 hypothetical protein SYNPS1DRAFT_20719 [Syncephalis pseudoplumigaleata]
MDSSSPAAAATSKHGMSKYDFVKLRVHLSSQHYYVLSRFLVSVLHATRIALDLKKRLVDRGALDVSQLELEQVLFQLMAEKGYGHHSIRLFWTLNRLHHQRVPLVILIGGAGSVGKSTLATQLAERLNLTNTLKTDLICEMTRSLLGLSETCAINTASSMPSQSSAARDPDACALVRRGLEIELRKCLSSGKSVIVEGEHVDVALLNFVLRCLDDDESDSFDAYSSSSASSSWGDEDAPLGIVVPFLLTVSDAAFHRELIEETSRSFGQPADATGGEHGDAAWPSLTPRDDRLARERMRQEALLKENAGQPAPLRQFITIMRDRDSAQHTLDRMHDTVLAEIAATL